MADQERKYWAKPDLIVMSIKETLSGGGFASDADAPATTFDVSG